MSDLDWLGDLLGAGVLVTTTALVVMALQEVFGRGGSR